MWSKFCDIEMGVVCMGDRRWSAVPMNVPRLWGGTTKRYNLKPFTDHKLTLILSVFRLPCTPDFYLNDIRLSGLRSWTQTAICMFFVQ